VPAWRETLTWYAMELRSALRERSIVINSILVPILLYPVLLWLVFSAVTFVRGKTEDFTVRVAVLDAPEALRPMIADIERDVRTRLVETRSLEQAESAVRSGRLDAALVFEPAADAADLPGNARVRLVFDGSRDRSREAKARLEGRLGGQRGAMLERVAKEQGIGNAEWAIASVSRLDRSSGREKGQFLLGLMLPTFLLLMCAIGCFYPAVDATAGERERGTWETLASSGIRRESVVFAKYLLVATFGILAGVLNLLAMTISMGRILAPLLERAGEDRLEFSIPWVALPVVLAGTVLLALFLAAGMMLLASFARTFGEGQTLVTPLYLLTILPIMLIRGTPWTVGTALIPVLNVAIMFREAISGRFDWPLILLTLAVEAVMVMATLRLAAHVLRFEDFLIGSHGGSLFRFLRSRGGFRAAKGTR